MTVVATQTTVELPIIEAVTAEAKECAQLQGVFLFGSTARGVERPRDLDLALLFPIGPRDPDRFRLIERFAFAVERRLGFQRPVDAIDLREAPPSLQLRVLTEGRRIVALDAVACVRFAAMAGAAAVDFVEFQRPYLEAWRNAVARGR